MAHHVFLGSTWNFTDEHAVIEDFESRAKLRGVRCHFNKRTQQFDVECSFEDRDEITLLLFETVKSKAEEEMGKVTHGTDQVDIRSISHMPELQQMEDMEAIHHLVDQQDAREESHKLTSNAELLIVHETLRRLWSPRLSRDETGHVFTAASLHNIGVATNSRLECSGEDIVILADSEEALMAVERKLGVLRKAYLTSMSLYFDFYVDEAHKGYHLRFRTPRQVVDHELATSQTFTRTHSELVMVWWDPVSQQFKDERCKQPILTSERRSLLWGEMFDFCFGDDSLGRFIGDEGAENPLRCVATPGTDPVARWAQQVSRDPIDPFLAADGSSHPSIFASQAPEFAFKTKRIPRREANQAEFELETPSQPEAMPAIKPIPETTSSPADVIEAPTLPHIVRGRPKATDPATQLGPGSRKLLIDTSSQGIMPSRPMATARPDLGPTSLDQQVVSSGGHGTQRPTRSYAAVASSAAKVPIAYSANKLDTASHELLSEVVKHDGEWNHIEAKDRDSLVESLQSEDESTSRAVMHTKSLLTPRNAKPKTDFDNMKNLLPALEQILDVTRARHDAIVVLEARLGHVFVRKDTISEQWQNTKSRAAAGFAPELWSTIFHTHKNNGKALTVFSSKLTGFWLDAEYLIELEDDRGTPLFRPPPENADDMPHQKTVVEIACRDERTGERTLLVVDDEHSTSIHSPWSVVGSANMHFPCRRWDASFRVKAASKTPRNVATQFQPVLDNLWVRGPGTDRGEESSSLDFNPLLTSRTGGKHIEIESIMLRRHVIYNSNPATVEGIQMNLTQVQMLRVEHMMDNRFFAFTTDDDEDKSTARRWWEMSLSSRRIDSMFAAENPGLETGELASYESWEDNKTDVTNLLRMVRLVTPRLDVIGQEVRASGSATETLAPTD